MKAYRWKIEHQGKILVSDFITDAMAWSYKENGWEKIEDDYKEINPLSEREKAIECIKALSRIEGYTMTIEELLKRTPALYDDIDYVMKYFDELLRELDK